MSKLINQIVKKYLKYVNYSLSKSLANPIQTQEKVFYKLLQNFKNTKYGKSHSLKSVKTMDSFKKALPLVAYEDIQPYIERMLYGESDVLVAGTVRYFSKSSGTTNDKSKFIPVPRQNLYGNHFKGSWDSLALFYNKAPDAELFHRKSLMISGSMAPFHGYPKNFIGDISAVMTHNMPTLARRFYTPKMTTAMLPNWDEKIVKITNEIIHQDVTMFGGVPTWLLVIFKEVLKKSGKSNLLELWPNLKGYFHGGVGFAPYYNQFKELIPSKAFIYHEIYNASEGFIGVQDLIHTPGMALLVNNALFYEFVPMDQWESPDPETVTLKDVEINKPYAIIISSNNGLMRYKIGDVVSFSSTKPYRFMVTGRTQHFINAFGEELMVANSDKALSMTCLEMNVNIVDYTAAPVYMTSTGKGAHEWLIEFERPPADIELFTRRLDANLRSINSDYDAKRSFDLAMEMLKITSLPRGTFHNWMRERKKLGGQNKVPRLANHRNFVDDILSRYVAVTISK